MEISIKTKNVTIDGDLKEFVSEKVSSLERFLDKPETLLAEVELSKTTEHHNKGDIFRAEVQIEVPGKLLRAESTREDLKIAIVEVKDQLQIQIKKYQETR